MTSVIPPHLLASAPELRPYRPPPSRMRAQRFPTLSYTGATRGAPAGRVRLARRVLQAQLHLLGAETLREKGKTDMAVHWHTSGHVRPVRWQSAIPLHVVGADVRTNGV